MRAFLLAAFLLLASARGATAQFTNDRFGINGGFALGSQTNAYSSLETDNSGGWGAGISMLPFAPASWLTMRFDLGYNSLPNVQYSSATSGNVLTNYQLYGATANADWRFIGVHRVTPYVIAGLGWYAVHSDTRLAILPPPGSGSSSTSTVGAVGFDYGAGLRISHVALEMKALQVMHVNTPEGKKTLYVVPVTLGLWF